MAAANGVFNGAIVALCVLTTLFLQILSNLANDYGDSKHGADSEHREGPMRAVQAGHIKAEHMKKGMIVFSLLSLVSGLALLWVAFGSEGMLLAVLFLGLGLASIWAAITIQLVLIRMGMLVLAMCSCLFFSGWWVCWVRTFCRRRALIL